MAVFKLWQRLANHHLSQMLHRFIFRRALTRDFPMAQHGRTITQRLDFIEFVTDVHNAAPFRRQLTQGLK